MTVTISLPHDILESLTLCVQSLLWPEPMFMDNDLHPFKPSRYHWMVSAKYKSWGVLLTPKFIDCILGPSLWCCQIAWGSFIFCAEQASGAHLWWLEVLSNKPICLWFKNINGVLNLLKQIICIKVPIPILPCLEKHTSFAVSEGESHRCQNKWKNSHSSPSFSQPHSDVKNLDAIIDWPSSFFTAMALVLPLIHSLLWQSFS